MKRKILFLFIFLLFSTHIFSQSDNCSTATNLTVTANCTSPVSGTTIGATQNIAGCAGNADDDVWYKFTATSTNHIITVVPSATMDPVVQLFSGICATLTSLYCMDNGMNGETEIINASGLTIGNVYTIRVYHYAVGSGSGTFTICVTQAPSPPSNDNCAGATLLNVNLACSYTNATSVSASQSVTGCVGTADDDVWFKFVATNSVQTITIDPSATMDPVVELYSGTCATLTSITCMDNGFTDGNEVISAVGLVPGNTYYVRVYDYYSGTGGAAFQICITGTPTAAPTNDDPCNAIQLPAVTSACEFLSFTTVGATTSAAAPTPASCSGGSVPQQGGFNNTPQPKDVWFKFTVPSSGKVAITAQPGYGISDGVMALYSGTCASLAQIACSDDYNYPGSANDFKPFIVASGLTPGATVYLRYWAYSGNTTGVFGICVSTPANDGCGGNLYICDLNNYAGTTSAAYTTDRPCNMRANAEMNDAPAYTYTPGTCQGGIFGLGGAWGTGAPNCDVHIDNNSWIKFTASNTTATLVVNIANCFVGNYPAGGIQMQIFSASSACCGFTPVSDFKEGSSQLSITANNLTIGNDYYLMIDGFASDICNYSITASAGVQFPDITTANSSICLGQTITLYGPAGASAYEWSPGGQTTQNITVTPAYSQTYSLEATGVCGYRQTRTIFITVNNPPTAASGNNGPVCENQTINLSASGGSSYSWAGPSGWTSTLQNPTRTNATLAMAGTYSVTVTSAAGCTSVSTTSVTVNSNPVITAGNTGPYCEGATISLSSSGGSSYSWSGPGSWTNTAQNPTRSNASTAMAGAYTVSVTGANSCIATGSTTVTVNSNPVISTGNTGPFCEGSTISLSSSGGTSYSWSGPGGWTSTSQNPTRANATTAMAGTYSVTVTNSNNCTAAGTTTVSVSAASVGGSATALPNSLCSGNTSVISVTGYTGNIQWQQSPNGVSGWTNIPGATSSSYTTPALSTTTYYRAVITSGTGCIAANSTTATVTVTALSSGGTATPVNTTICYNLPASITLSGYSGNIQWQQSSNGTTWTDIAGATSATLNSSNLTANTYFHAVVSNAGCAASNSNDVFITVNPNLQAGTINANQTLCSGLTPAGLTQSVAASGGTGSYTYQWQSSTDNVNWFNISGATSLTYNPPSLSVTTYYRRNVTSGSCGTVSSNTITITINSNPVADAGVNQNIFNGTNTPLTGSASGGSGSYTYSWTPVGSLVNANLQNPQTVNLSNTTVFTLTVNDINTGCQGTDQVTVFIMGGSLSVTASAVDYSVCRGSVVQLNAVGSGGNPGGYQYTWTSNVSSFTSNLASPTDIPTVNTIYTVSLFDGSNTVTDTVNVIVFSLPIANAGNDASICNGNSATISAAASTGTAVLSFNWSNGISGVSQNVSPTTNTTYTVTVTDGYGCTQTDAVIINVNPLPSQFVVTGGGSYCAGGTGVAVSLSGSETNTNYQLQLNGSNTGIPVAGTGLPLIWNNLTTAGTYTVVATTSFTCTSPMLQSATISINPLPTPVITGAIDVCQGAVETYAVTNITGHSYSWNISGGTPTTASSSSVDVTWGNSSPGIITVTETILSTMCAVTTNSYAVVIHAVPVAYAGLNDTICAGENTTLSATGSTGSIPLSYAWNNGVGTGISHVVTPGVTVIYTVTVTDVYFCASTDQVSITVNELPVIDAGGNVSICSGSSVTIIATPVSGTLPFTYAWDHGLSSAASHVVSPVNTTTYHVSVTDAKQCSGKDSVTVSVYTSPLADIGPDKIICNGTSVLLDASSSSGTQPLIFTWNNGLSSGSLHIVTPLVTTSYYLTLTDNNLCKDYDTVVVTVNSIPVAEAGVNITVCSAVSVLISASASTGNLPLQFSWSNSVDSVSQTVSPDSNTTYFVTVTDVNNCSKTDSVKITVASNPFANAGADTNVCRGASFNIDASSSTGSLPLTYVWNNSLGSGAVHSFVSDSSQVFVVTVTDNNNCTDTDSVKIFVLSAPDFTVQTTNTTCTGNNDGNASFVNNSVHQPASFIWSTGGTGLSVAELLAGNYSITVIDSTGCMNIKTYEIKDAADISCLEIPSAFTPNHDGTNDTWEIKHINIYPEASVEIFNRWGVVIFSSDNYTDSQNAWDGKYNKNDVPAGSYVYILKLNKETDPIHGIITIIR